jgi:hypothetical protein
MQPCYSNNIYIKSNLSRYQALTLQLLTPSDRRVATQLFIQELLNGGSAW